MKFQRSLAAETVIGAQPYAGSHNQILLRKLPLVSQKKIINNLNGEVFTQTSPQGLKGPRLKEVLHKTSCLND